MTEEKPKDFLMFICKKCPEEIDDWATYPGSCVCFATRDHAPTLCPCRGEPRWKIDHLIWKGGEEP